MNGPGHRICLCLFCSIIAVSGCRDDDIDPVPPPAASSSETAEPKFESATLPSKQVRNGLPRDPQPDDWFEDVTDGSGIRFAYRDGSDAGFYTLLETVGGGVAMLDYDRDGDVDLFFTGGGRLTGPPIEVHGLPSGLFRNDGGWHFTDVTVDAGLADSGLYTHGAAVGDFDNDGFPDLFVAGYLGCRLYRNLGCGRFADVTDESGLYLDTWNVTAAWADFDNDGWLDLYVVTYADWKPDHRRFCPNDREQRDTCAPTSFEGTQDWLWRNRGDGTFEDFTHAAGLVPANRGLGVVAADVNRDGYIDFYVVNDVEENQLYLGGPRLPFQSAGVKAGVAFSPAGKREGSMGVDVGDFDEDGLPDLWYTNFANDDNTLYRNLGNGSFVDATVAAGLAGRSRQWVGFGTGFGDFDSDGRIDLVVANGHVRYGESTSPYYQPAQLFRKSADGHFEEQTDRGGPYFSVPHAGRGLAVGDLDNDGALDLAIVHQNDPVALLKNRRHAANWVRVELQGTTSNRDAVGAAVTASFNGRPLTRWVKGGGGFVSQSDRRLVFLLGGTPSLDVSVKWPSGRTELFRSLSPGQTHLLVEGQADAERRPASGNRND